MKTKYLIIIAVLHIFICSLGGDEMTVRKCSGAGRWFEGSAASLKREVNDYFSKVENKYEGKKIAAIISPHAGFVYSGKAAAAGYVSIKNAQYKRVIMLGVNHTFYLQSASIMNVDAYETPLGSIYLDRPVVEKLLKEKCFASEPRAHYTEHSIENQLPFLQEGLKEGFKIVPILVGDMSEEGFESIATSIKPFVNEDTLIVVSSDFTHYGKYFDYYPFKDDVKENLRKLDMGAADFINAKDYEGFRAYLKKTGATICGRNAISVLLKILPDECTGDVATYYTSGDLTDDYSSSVSYASIVFYKE